MSGLDPARYEAARERADALRAEAADLRRQAEQVIRSAEQVERSWSIPRPCHLCGARGSCSH